MIRLNKIFVSIIPENHGGAGDYLVEVKKDYPDFKFFITPNFFLKKKIFNRVSVFFFSKIFKLLLNLIIRFIKINKLVIFHQQSIGYKLTKTLIDESDQVDFYVVDTNFFCKKSYNEHENMPCFRCLEKFQPFENCKHEPYKENDKDYLGFIDSLYKKKGSVKFIVQTIGFKKLILKKYFDSDVVIKKMTHPKLIIDDINHQENLFKYDFSYHAHLTAPKGFNYFLDLSKKMKKFQFFLPSNKNLHINQFNLENKKLEWGSELIDVLLKSKIILCPSLWTYPVESAVIKSLNLGRAVAIIDTEFSFANEIPDNAIIKLKGDVEIDSKILKDIIDNEEYNTYAYHGLNWVKDYLKK